MNPFSKRIHQIKNPDLDLPKGTRNPFLDLKSVFGFTERNTPFFSLLVSVYTMCNETETTTVTHFFRGFDVLTANTSPLDPVNFTIFDHVVCCWRFTFLSCEAGQRPYFLLFLPIPYLFRRLLPAAAQATFHQHERF